MEHRVIEALQFTVTGMPEQLQQANRVLDEMRVAPGIVTFLLQLVTVPNLDESFRLAAVVYLKNTVKARWRLRPAPPDVTVLPQLSLEECEAIKRTLVPTMLAGVPSRVRGTMQLILKRAVTAHFPEHWPDLLPQIMAGLHSTSLEGAHNALYVLEPVVKKYQYHHMSDGARLPLFGVIEAVFPTLVSLFGVLLSIQPPTAETGDSVRLLCKIFWYATQLHFPAYLLNRDNLMPWMNHMLQVLVSAVPEEGQPSDPAQRPKYSWWKAKKWVGHIFTRLFSKINAPPIGGETEEECTAFNTEFTQLYSTKLLEAFFFVLNNLRHGVYLPERLITLSLVYINTSIRHANTFAVLRAHMDVFLQQILFPLLCFRQADADLWLQDPAEYCRRDTDPFQDMYFPKNEARNLLIDLVKLRSRQNFFSFMAFISNTLTAYAQAPPEQRNPREKDGALQAIRALSWKLKDMAEFAPILESMLAAHVLPEFQSEHPFLRARACELFGEYFDLEYPDPSTFMTGLQSTLALLRDPELPVRVAAAISLRYIIQNPIATEQLRPQLATLLSEVFRVMSEIDLDDLVSTLQVIIEVYEDAVAPYALQLCQSLVGMFSRLGADGDDETAQGSAITAGEALHAAAALLEATHQRPELYPQLEELLYPLLLDAVSTQNHIDFMEEILRLLSYLTFYSASISPRLWTLFAPICASLCDWAVDFAGELLTPMDNFIARDPDTFINGGHLPELMQVVVKLLNDPESAETDCRSVCQMIESVLLACRGRVDAIIEPVLTIVVARLNIAKYASLKVLLIEVIANAVYYNPLLTLQVLEGHGWTHDIFLLWFRLVQTSFTRYHDKKLAIISLSSLLLLSFEQLPTIVQSGFKSVLENLMKLIHDIEKMRVDLEAEQAELAIEAAGGARAGGASSTTADGDADGDDSDSGDEEIEAADDQDIHIDRDELRRLTEAARQWKEGNVDDDDLDDDDDFTSNLDDVDEIIYFVEALQQFSRTNGTVWRELVLSFPQEVHQGLQQINALAEQRRQVLAARAASSAPLAVGPAGVGRPL